jgi:hypothetical protein
MSTGNFADWQGPMTEIGPMYPFVGSEMLWAGIALALYVVWVIMQWGMESRNYEDDLKVLKVPGNMERALKGEKILRPM